MKTQVMYYSRSGNTKKVADAIAQALGQVSKSVPLDYPMEDVDILFLGAGAYANQVGKRMIEFISTLNSSQVKNVVLFGTNGGHENSLSYMRGLLWEQGIKVIEKTYSCKGKFFFFIHRKHPSDEDLRKAQEFAKALYEKLNH